MAWTAPGTPCAWYLALSLSLARPVQPKGSFPSQGVRKATALKRPARGEMIRHSRRPIPLWAIMLRYSTRAWIYIRIHWKARRRGYSISRPVTKSPISTTGYLTIGTWTFFAFLRLPPPPAIFLLRVPRLSECPPYSSPRLPPHHPQAHSRLPITCGLHPSLSPPMSTSLVYSRWLLS